jgi:hypothetical protein
MVTTFFDALRVVHVYCEFAMCRRTWSFSLLRTTKTTGLDAGSGERDSIWIWRSHPPTRCGSKEFFSTLRWHGNRRCTVLIRSSYRVKMARPDSEILSFAMVAVIDR